MMNEPPINDLLKKSENRYTLAVEVAKRARQLVEGKQPLYDPRQENPKPMAVAIEEVNRGLITYTRPEGAEE